MQIKIFTIPIMGGEAMEAELNAFLRGRKVLQVEQQLVSGPNGSSWTFCVRYIEGQGRSAVPGKKVKKDYKSELSEKAFCEARKFCK